MAEFAETLRQVEVAVYPPETLGWPLLKVVIFSPSGPLVDSGRTCCAEIMVPRQRLNLFKWPLMRSAWQRALAQGAASDDRRLRGGAGFAPVQMNPGKWAALSVRRDRAA